MTNVIRHPFGGDQGMETLKKVAAATAGTITRTVTNAYSFLRCATATKGKKIVLNIANTVPAGAVLVINAATASSETLLGTGFAIQSFLSAGTAGKGTGNWICPFINNGSAFIPLSTPLKVNKRYK